MIPFEVELSKQSPREALSRPIDARVKLPLHARDIAVQ